MWKRTRRRGRRDRRGTAHRRNPAQQHLRGRYQPGLGRNRQAGAVASHRARVGAALVAGAPIRIGNSLVGDDFWRGRQTADAEERVRSFDWRAAFPEVWPDGRDGGFDIVLGNPPYVKLQNLMKVDPDVVAYLRQRAETTPTPARRPAISTFICRSSRRACGCSHQAAAWPSSPRACGR